MHLAENDTNWFEPPAYIKDGLEWLTNQLEPRRWLVMSKINF